MDTLTTLMKTLVLEGSNNPSIFDLNPGLNKVGRNPTNDIRISDLSVSSFHCEIDLTEHAVRIRDLASTNGTFVDGESVLERTLEVGQKLLIGSAEFILSEKEVVISIPSVSTSEDSARKPPTMLPDGSPACSVYPDVPAVYECRRCKKFFCRDAVRSINISGGESLLFGHKCHGPCDLEARFESNQNTSPNFFGRITQTIRMRRS